MGVNMAGKCIINDAVAKHPNRKSSGGITMRWRELPKDTPERRSG